MLVEPGWSPIFLLEQVCGSFVMLPPSSATIAASERWWIIPTVVTGSFWAASVITTAVKSPMP